MGIGLLFNLLGTVFLVGICLIFNQRLDAGDFVLAASQIEQARVLILA